MQAVMWLAASASTAFVGLRCYVRLGKRNAFGLDDIIALAATVRDHSQVGFRLACRC